jgi:hypothetical protein
MIDVHPPEHGIHGVRDFFIHLLTITIGLLIALGLENVAEAMHHRHQRNEAVETIRQELRANHEHLETTRPRMDAELETLKQIAQCLQQKEKAASCDGIRPGMTVVQLDTAAWSTAKATGVLQYMDYKVAQNMASAYDIQEMFLRLQTETLDSYLKLSSHIAQNMQFEKMSPEDAKETLLDVHTAMAHLVAMSEVSREVVNTYDEALKED